MKKNIASKSLIKPLLMLFATCLFATSQFSLQGIVGVISQSIRNELDLDATSVSIISSAFYYTFMILQIPAGILIDRKGVRRVSTAACLFLAFGTFLFSITNSLNMAVFSRMIMGIGGAFGFISLLAVGKAQFSPRYFPVIVSLSETVVMSAVFIFNTSVAFADNVWGWRSSLWYIAYGIFLLAIMIYIILHDQKLNSQGFEEKIIQDQGSLSWFGLLVNFKTVLNNKLLWFSGIYGGCINIIVIVWASLWGVPFVSKLLSVSSAEAAQIISLIYIGIAVSSPFLGWFVLRCGYLPLMAFSSWLAFILISVVLYLPGLSIVTVAITMFFLGVVGSCYQLSYSFSSRVAGESREKNQSAIMGFTNLCTMISAPILQPMIGVLVSWRKDEAILDGFESYSLQDYQFGLILLPLLLLVAAIFSTRMLFYSKQIDLG